MFLKLRVYGSAVGARHVVWCHDIDTTNMHRNPFDSEVVPVEFVRNRGSGGSRSGDENPPSIFGRAPLRFTERVLRERNSG